MPEDSSPPICGHETATGGECQNPATDGEYCWIDTHGDPDAENPHGAPERNTNAKGNDGGAPEPAKNASSHGLYAKTNNFYQEVIGEDLRELCDGIFADYLSEYKDRHGDIPLGHEARLFEISVNHIKIIHADNWAVDKPDTLDSGNPMVDRESEQKFVEGVGPVTEYTYSETVVVGTQQKLRREDRAWLREYGLLDSPEQQQADAVGDLASIIADES